MTLQAIFAVVVVAIALGALWHEILDVADDALEPDVIAYVDADGEYVELRRPEEVSSIDVWEALAWIQQLPEVAHA